MVPRWPPQDALQDRQRAFRQPGFVETPEVGQWYPTRALATPRGQRQHTNASYVRVSETRRPAREWRIGDWQGRHRSVRQGANGSDHRTRSFAEHTSFLVRSHHGTHSRRDRRQRPVRPRFDLADSTDSSRRNDPPIRRGQQVDLVAQSALCRLDQLGPSLGLKRVEHPSADGLRWPVRENRTRCSVAPIERLPRQRSPRRLRGRCIGHSQSTGTSRLH